MAVSNFYTTLANVKGLKRITSTDTVDDAVIERLIGSTSRMMDTYACRHFYPRIETRYFDVPDTRTLWLDADLLAVTTLANGDGSAILAADYLLVDKNATPYYSIRLTDVTDIYWVTDANGSYEKVISVLGTWGYHNDFGGAWLLGSTLNEGAGLNASDLTWTVNSGTLFTGGQIVKIDSEIMNVSGVVTNDVTVVRRGDNGSTAATHLNGASVYIWQPMLDIAQACEDIVITVYNRRFGVGQESGEATITAAGVVISPRDITEFARTVLNSYRRGF